MGGLAELFSGAISMGLGAYLAAATERAHYHSEAARTRDAVRRRPAAEREAVYALLARYHISRAAAVPLVDELCQEDDDDDDELSTDAGPSKQALSRKTPRARKDADEVPWVRFLLDVEQRLACPAGSRAWLSALTMGLSYFVGGLIPMVPYFVLGNARDALLVSVAITAVVLLVFGYVKTALTVHSRSAGVWGALQTLVIGALAAGAAYGIVRALDSGKGQP
ncbi:vacuolar iron transporter [Niveomyces insectorum RCEF 264]|uniref:Vacuolar iron transporter n=1 Tax=Niveomyces insectorum RCEF 264 TaxID=1081102 RepID=A0A167QG19_9HYPO|nr:vacuolar iron transporter [Niveomyces insectorum RCEF 264]